VVFPACSHGLANVLMHAQSVFPEVGLRGVVGGLHLSGATEKIIPRPSLIYGSLIYDLLHLVTALAGEL
jgi:metal-dependent hydrolase (beta-lactamase superfamily II)